MGANSRNTPGVILKQLQALSEGLATSLPRDLKTLYLDGVPTDAADLKAEIDEIRALYDEVERLRSALRTAVLKRNAKARRTRDVINRTRTCLENRFGRKSAQLHKFGFTPRKDRRKLTTDETLAKAEKARATRLARGTMGKRQRLAIKRGVPPAPDQAQAWTGRASPPTTTVTPSSSIAPPRSSESPPTSGRGKKRPSSGPPPSQRA